MSVGASCLVCSRLSLGGFANLLHVDKDQGRVQLAKAGELLTILHTSDLYPISRTIEPRIRHSLTSLLI